MYSEWDAGGDRSDLAQSAQVALDQVGLLSWVTDQGFRLDIRIDGAWKNFLAHGIYVAHQTCKDDRQAARVPPGPDDHHFVCQVTINS